MPRDWRVFVEDMRRAVSAIEEYTNGFQKIPLESDRRTYDAVIRNLEVLGEAAKAVPDEIRSQYPDIEWKKLAGLRDILIHQYFGIDAEIIIDVVTIKLPALKTSLHDIASE
ncbi:MAG: DUF86 domain-containing protein [Verrucomicrobia bacterium]|nr:DUF86 domain-containing protein [Verrucomicrobiota bacterium]